MAEFCLECWNRLYGDENDKRKYVISKEVDFCEGCGEWKPVIIAERRFYYLHKLRYITLPFRVIGKIIYILWRILILPYLLFVITSRKIKDREPFI